MEWISVEDRLPENGVEVIASAAGVVRPAMAYHGAHTEWCELQRYDNMSGVTHWMPLPDPPKEDNE